MSEWSAWEQIDDGKWNGLRKLIRSSDAEEGTVQVKYEDVGGDQIIEANKSARTHKLTKDVWHVGSIPASVGMKWLVEEGIDLWNPEHQPAVLRKLMDSDYRHLVPGMSRIIL